jgi:putative SOS response-associated peptidase YedK
MCGRTGQAILPEVIEARWDVDVPDEYEPRFNVAPRDQLAVIPNNEPDALDLQHWGLLPRWVDDPEDWNYPINARCETVHEKPSFRDAYAKRTCLVLSDGFYEWAGDRGSKQPYRICREDGEPFAFAGIWEQWSKNGTDRESVCIITCDANDVVSDIHDRMPVILQESDEPTWLDGDPEVRRELLKPNAGDDLEAYPISTKVNDPSYDQPDIIEPLDHEQGGLGDFAA